MLDGVGAFVHVPVVPVRQAAEIVQGQRQALGQGGAAGLRRVTVGAAQPLVGLRAVAQGLFQHPLQIAVIAVLVGRAHGAGGVVAAHQRHIAAAGVFQGGDLRQQRLDHAGVPGVHQRHFRLGVVLAVAVPVAPEGAAVHPGLHHLDHRGLVAGHRRALQQGQGLGQHFLAAQIHHRGVAHRFHHIGAGHVALLHQVPQAHIEHVVAVGRTVGGVGVGGPPVAGGAVVPTGQIAARRVGVVGVRFQVDKALPVELAVAPAGQLRVHPGRAARIEPGMEKGDVAVVDVEPVETTGGVIEHLLEAAHVMDVVAGRLHEGQGGIQLGEIGAALAGQRHRLAGHGGEADHRAVLGGADHPALHRHVLADGGRVVGGHRQVPARRPGVVDHIEGPALAAHLVAAFTVGRCFAGLTQPHHPHVSQVRAAGGGAPGEIRAAPDHHIGQAGEGHATGIDVAAVHRHFQQQLGHEVAGLRAEHRQRPAAGTVFRVQQQGVGDGVGEAVAQTRHAAGKMAHPLTHRQPLGVTQFAGQGGGLGGVAPQFVRFNGDPRPAGRQRRLGGRQVGRRQRQQAAEQFADRVQQAAHGAGAGQRRYIAERGGAGGLAGTAAGLGGQRLVALEGAGVEQHRPREAAGQFAGQRAQGVVDLRR